MPEFSPSYQAVATARFTVKPAGITCFAELFLVQDESVIKTSGLVEFVSTGVKESIAFPVTMPANYGTYQAWLDIVAADVLIGAYQGIEDVVIGEAIITSYRVTLIGAPSTGNVPVIVKIPQAAAYVGDIPTSHRVDSRLQVGGYFPVTGPWRIITVPVGQSTQEIEFVAADAWSGGPLPPGIYSLYVRILKLWTSQENGLVSYGPIVWSGSIGTIQL